MATFSLLMLLLLVGSGIYSIYLWLRLRKEWCLTDNKFMLPGNCSAADCLDEDGFLEYIAPKIALFGMGLVLLGLLYLPCIFNLFITSLLMLKIMSIAVPVLTLLLFVWFMFVQHKASKLFW
ncbi:MAG: hypothetical protein MJ085_03140 [Clostridia bacterium]|nr:hypothetical protein [Clostridia bacterium]